MINKVKSVKVSEAVFNLVDGELDYINENGCQLYARLDTFNNCRETGFYLTVLKIGEPRIYIWAFECRNSDDIVVVISTVMPNNGMFDEEAYDKKKFFSYNGEHEASDYISKKIIEHFNIKVGE